MKIKILSLLLLTTLVVARAQEVNSFIASDGEKLHYTKYGAGTVVVFLFGGPGYAVSAMKPWAERLSDDYQCILFDQRGTGLSSKARLNESTINLERAVQDLDDLRTHLKLNQLTLCGTSWGGMLAQAYAAYFPKKTKGIILVSTLGPDMDGFPAFTDNMNMRRFPEERDSLKYWRNQPLNSLSELKQSFYLFIPEFYDHEIGYKMLPVLLKNSTYHGDMADLMWSDLNKSYNLGKKLSEYKGECIIIRPRQDPVPAEAVYRILDLIPQARMIFIEKCGHFPDFEQPDEFFKILKEVLSN